MRKIFTLIVIFLFPELIFGQTSNYEKQVLFTLNWGNELNQPGKRKAEEGEMGDIIGPSDFAVLHNNFWIYDRVNNYIKCFNDKGELLCNTKLLCQAGIEGNIDSDGNQNIWFNDAMGYRIWVYNENGELQKTIKYKVEGYILLGNVYY